MIEYMRETPKRILVQLERATGMETANKNVLHEVFCVQTRPSVVGVVAKQWRIIEIAAQHRENRDEERSLTTFRMGHGSTVVPGPFSWFLGHRPLGGKLRRRSEAG